MATYTTYLNLEKPATSENFDLLKINANWDKVDAGVAKIGTMYGGNGTVNSVASSTYTEIQSVSIPAGTYIILRGCDFDANATGTRRIGKSSGSGREEFITVNAMPSGDTIVQHMEIITVSETTEIKNIAYQTSGSSLSIWSFMKAIRIR